MEQQIDKEYGLFLYKEMLRIRRFEEKCVEKYSSGDIRGFLHLYIGEEAIATGVMQVLTPEDKVFTTYREHGHALARGMTADAIMAEMYGKQEGCSKGRGGSMHLFSKDLNFFGGNAIVGGSLPVATGMAMAHKMKEESCISACFFGEGAIAEGEFHESMNLASLWQLPVLFICENNGYAMGTPLTRNESQTDLCSKTRNYGIATASVDGMDVLEVIRATKEARAYVQKEKKPFFLECKTYRFRAHSMFDPELYRKKEEVEEWKKHGPLVKFLDYLRRQDLVTEDDLTRMEAEVSDEIAKAVEFAEQGTLEPVEDLTRFVYQKPIQGARL